MSEQLLAPDTREPEELVAEAHAEFGPFVRSYCLVSGGDDSTAVAYRCRELYDELAFFDTGTALPGVREHVERVAHWLGKPLTVIEAGDTYAEIVLGRPEWWAAYDRDGRARGLTVGQAIKEQLDRGRGHAVGAPFGFPGPAGGHTVAYNRLKERSIEELTRQAKRGHDRRARVALLSGVRRHESRRRMRTLAKGPIEKVKGKARVWVAPLYDWTNEQLREYRNGLELPRSDVAALLHRSGECNCGAYIGPDERAEVEAFFPEWVAEVIVPLEQRARELGVPRCIWGERADSGRPGARGVVEEVVPGMLCSGCPGQMALLEAHGR